MLSNAEEKLEEMKGLTNNHKGMIFYTFEYADESGTYFCIMEHGGIFSNLPHYTESHH